MKGKPSAVAVATILQDHEEKKRGVIRKSTPQEQRTARAKRILLAPYLGDPDQIEEQTGSVAGLSAPFPGMGIDEAQTWMAWVKGGHCPAPVWLEIQDVYDNIYAAAQVKA